MQIGCSAPTSGPLIEPDSLLRIATEAENLGYDYVTVSDHIMIPTSIASRYPYSESGEFPPGAAAPSEKWLPGNRPHFGSPDSTARAGPSQVRRRV